MGNEVEVDIDGMSDEDLLKLERKLDEEESSSGEAQEGRENKEEVDDPEGKEANAEDVKPEEESEKTPSDGESEEDKQDDIHKDVSPPEKWIQQRVKARERAESEHHKDIERSKQSDLQKELDDAKQILELMKAKGINIPSSPQDMLSEENIKDVREEYGDTVADMFLALRAIIPKPEEKKEDAAQPVDEGKAGEDRVAVLFQNDHLSYWFEEKPEFFDKYAVAADAELLKDPDFNKKTYSEQANAIVEKAKELALSEKKPVVDPVKTAKKGGAEPPNNLGGLGGATPANNNKGPADKMIELAEAGRDDEAMKIYETLPDGDEKLKFENWMDAKEE